MTSEFSPAIGFGHHNLRKQVSDVTSLRQQSDHKQFHVYVNLPETKELWSRAIRKRWEDAWEATIHEVARQFGPQHRLHHAVLHREEQTPRFVTLDYDQEDGKPFLPCRRIYQGGDDLSFVCDARIAIALTAYLIRQLEKEDTTEKLPALFKQMTVSAGIVFVDSHFPFGRAVHLAENVRQNAKKHAQKIKKLKESRGEKGAAPSVLDWWINRQGDMARPESVYPGATMKPYVLHATPASVGALNWEQLEMALPALWELFRETRNKLKDVLAAVEAGENGMNVKRLLRLRPLSQNGIPAKAPFQFLGTHYNAETGFLSNGYTPLIDAGELFDIHFPFRAVDTITPEKNGIDSPTEGRPATEMKTSPYVSTADQTTGE